MLGFVRFVGAMDNAENIHNRFSVDCSGPLRDCRLAKKAAEAEYGGRHSHDCAGDVRNTFASHFLNRRIRLLRLIGLPCSGRLESGTSDLHKVRTLPECASKLSQRYSDFGRKYVWSRFT